MTIKEVSEKYGISQDTLRYYERVNVIPKVTRTSGGIRDYQEEDLRWVELAVCMRNAGLPIESLIEYQRLFRAGDSTIPARLELLNEQMDILQKQKEQIEETTFAPLQAAFISFITCPGQPPFVIKGTTVFPVKSCWCRNVFTAGAIVYHHVGVPTAMTS